MSFAERFDRRPPGAYTERIRPSRGQSLLPMFEPPPPHTIHVTPEKPPKPIPETPRAPPPTSNGEKSKARDILAAIRTLQAIEREHRPATSDERGTLSRFGGFGPVALSIFPDPVTGKFKDAGWEQIGGELKTLLTSEEYDSAKRTTFSQFFTAPVVMDAMHDALKQLGVPADGLVLEPGCGNGRFMTGPHRYIGVELDSLSGRIARALHPQADIRIENFRDSKLPPLDAVIGNVPFADVKLDLNGQKFSLHDFCIAKSADSLKPGGVLAVVTSHYTLDKQNAAAREYLASKADFLGAIRLPSDAFKREGTSVVTDILFLRKRAQGQEPKHAGEWLSTGTLALEGASVPVNGYFLKHPEMVLGDWSRKDTLYGGEGFSVIGNGELASQLKEAIARLPKVVRSEAERANPPPLATDTNVASKSPEKAPAFIPPPPLKHLTEGSFFVGLDKIIRQIEDGQADPVTYGGTQLKSNGTMTGTRLAGLIELRDHARRVLQSQNEGWPDGNRAEARRDLNRTYDRFTASYGPINKTTFSETKDGTQIRRMPNLAKFREDPDAMLVMSLEEYDEATGTAEKSAIMKKDVVGPKPPITHVSSAEEGLLVSLNDHGAIDLPYIAKLYRKPEAEIVAELGDLIYRDPQTKAWETADAYLSGNVRAKLATAEKAGPEYARNAVALRSVQPEDVLPGDIDANLGAPWIPAKDIQAFAAQLFNVPAESFKIGHLKKDAVWSVEPDYRAIQSVAATADYGTSRINGTELLSLALNLRTPVIYDTVRGANGDERVLNPEETQAAREKQRLVKDKFKSWIFTDPDRTERLVRDYNDTYNNLRPRLFDGSHLDFSGMNSTIQLRQHQLDAIWRCMSSGNTLLAHTVGAGKAQPLDAKVLTPAGWMQMGDLRVGDNVISGDGTATAITGVYPQGQKDIVRVVFSDGSATECCEEHLWLTQDYYERGLAQRGKKLGRVWPRSDPKIRTTAEIAATLLAPHLGAKNHSIPIVSPVQFAEQPVPLDPYFLGVLLGDGSMTTSSVTLTNPDEEILGYIRLPENVILSRHVVSDKKCQSYGFPMIERSGFGASKTRNPVLKILEELELIGKKSATKFIPECYKINTPDVRLAVLQGLLDTDGYVQKNGASTYYYTVSSRLADDVTFLVQSLGGIVKRRVKEHPTYRHLGELRVGQPCFVICISMPPDIVPFRLSRKAELARPKTSYQPCRYIVAVEPVGKKEAQCIAVEHPSRLYVTDDFIVTHNTYEMCAAGMKMKQSGLIHKPLYCIPNHMLEQFSREFMQLYPNAKLLVASKEDFTKDRRKLLTAKIATGDWDGIIVTHSSFERIGMSRDYQERFLRDQIKEYEHLLVDKASTGRNIIKTIEKQKARREEKLKDLLAEDKKDTGLVFDELGIDHIFYDESVAVKNLETASKMERVAGIQLGGSEKAFDMYMKASYLDEQHQGHGVTFASGTPVSNSMVEMYTLQRFLDLKSLKDSDLEHFDGWAATFGEVVDTMEISPDGASLRPRSRFAKFVNLPELVQMFRAFADVQTADDLNLPRPALEGGKPQTIACPMSEEQRELQAGLIKRYDRIRSSKVDPREDNALAITTDGRKLALDGRMLQPGPDHPDSKINALVKNVARIWKQTEPTRGTQMVFADMGVNPTPWGFSAYDEVAGKLEQNGIPRHQIAIMGDADTDAKKQALFEKVRQGTVRVLIGSTAKMGTGTNVQKRLVALHHLDAPWKPAEVEQREGRILRQGNQNKEVAIYRYVTEGSFDAFMWQALETKARFIAQVMSGDCAVRKAEDIGGQELSYAEVKAIASGNPAVLTLAETDAELQRLAILRKNHHDEQYLARRNLRDLPDSIRHLTKRVEGLTTDMGTMAANDVTLTTEGIGVRMSRMPEKVSETYRTPLGGYRGLEAGIILHPLGGTEVYLDGAVRCREQLMRDNPGPRAVLNALDRLADGYGDDIRHLKSEISLKEGQLKDYESRLGKPFQHEEYASQLADLRDKLKMGLSEKAPEGGTPTAELAEQIKALRASVTVEATPERVTRKAVRAERPVTARIRERMGEPQTSPEPIIVPTKAEPVKPTGEDDQPAGKPAGFGASVAQRRQGGGAQMRMF